MAKEFGNGINLKGQKAVNLADGSNPSDAATWGQVQQFLAGLAWKSPGATAATTGNINLASPGASIDGVNLALDNLVLVKNQTDQTQNGLYLWKGAAVPMVRASNADTGAKLQNAAITVAKGTVNADKAWTQTSDDVVIGTTNIVWAPFGAGMTYTPGNGLQLSGGEFSLKLPASSGLVADGTGLYVDPSIVVRKYASNFGDGSATAYTITHNLNTKDVQVTIFDNATGLEEETDVGHPTVNTVTLTYAYAIAAGAKRVVIQG